MRAYTTGTPTSANYRARWVASLQVYPAGHKYAGCTMPFRPHGPNVPYVCPSSWTHEDSARGGPADPPPWTGPPVPNAEPTVVEQAPAAVLSNIMNTTSVTTGNADVLVSFVHLKPGEVVGLAAPFDLKGGAPHHPYVMKWSELAVILSMSKPGDFTLVPDVAKRQRGGWVPGTYSVSVGHADLASALVSTVLLVLDVDHGDPHDLAEIFAEYETIIHTTYKHTPETPRCRVVFLLNEPCSSPADIDEAHTIFEKLLAREGIKAPAKDARCGRLAYMPMYQKGVAPVHLVTHGKRLDLEALVAPYRAQRGSASAPTPRRQREPKTGSYAQAALRKATEHVAWADEGERHNILVAEGASLSRPDLGLDAETIVEALLPAAVMADPDTDEREHLRNIRWGLKKGGLV